MKKIVLSVDDMPEILAGVKSVLKGYYDVFGVTGAAEAMKFLLTREPDLFILDIDMPLIDGYDTATLIRMDEKHKNTPIIFLTSNSTRGHVLKAIEAGGNDYMVKPINRELLLSKAQKFLD